MCSCLITSVRSLCISHENAGSSVQAYAVPGPATVRILPLSVFLLESFLRVLSKQ